MTLLSFYKLNGPSCADGSPAGFYTDFFDRLDKASVTSENSRNRSLDSLTRHTIVFRGGGGCYSAESCAARRNIPLPTLFGTGDFPKQIHGSTILSSDEGENPALYGNVRWIVPYCTQDLWLGKGTIDESGLIRSGSLIVGSFWDEFERIVSKAQLALEQVVVVGISAGTVAVLNHFDRLQQVAPATSNTILRIILDSPDFGEEVGDDMKDTFAMFVEDHVDPIDHPLCHDGKDTSINVSQNTSTVIGDLDIISDIPCCASVHCILRNELNLLAWASGDEQSSADQLMLLLGSTFDPIATIGEVSFPVPSIDSSLALSDISNIAWDVGSIAGQSRTRMLETVQYIVGGNSNMPGSSPSARIRWALSSATAHPFILESLELEKKRCFNGMSYVEAGTTVSCDETGSSFSAPFFRDLQISIRLSADTWKLSAVEGQSIQDIIGSVIVQQHVASISSTEALIFPALGVATYDTCSGPNCVQFGSNEQNPAQQLVSVEETFAPLPLWLQIIVTIIFLMVPVSAGIVRHSKHIKRTKKQMLRLPKEEASIDDKLYNDDVEEEHNENQNSTEEGRALYVNGLNVVTVEGQRILEDVSVRLEAATFTGLVGLSGSGKSTLMSALAQQTPSDLMLSIESSTDLSDFPTALLRQADAVAFEMMSPSDYLTATAKVYGTSQDRIDEVFNLVRPFFTVRKERLASSGKIIEEKIVLDPFEDNVVGRLSGGQRKMLAIAATLFVAPKLLLLDEPLSGLDSTSSERLCDLLRDVAKNEAVTILMILHQPSNEILHKLDGIILMCKGRVLLEQTIQSMRGDFSPSEFVHTKLVDCNSPDCPICHHEKGSAKLSTFEDIGAYLSDVNDEATPLIENSKEQVSKQQLQDLQSKRWNHCVIEMNQPWNLWQVPPLIQRMQIELGFPWKDLLVLPVCFVLVTSWLRFEAGSPIQIYTATTLFVVVPTIVFQPRLIVACNVFLSHHLELEDRRISSVAYDIASTIFTFGVPFVAIILAHIIGYVILGWEWNTFLVQILFVIAHTTASIQVGKTLSVAARGDYTKLTRWYVLFVFLSILFSGFFVNTRNVPEYLIWLVYLSLTFWGLSGAQLNQLQYNSALGQDSCLSFASCIAGDGNFLARYFGYSPITTTLLSFVVLLIWLVAFLCIEGILLAKVAAPSANNLNSSGKMKKNS